MSEYLESFHKKLPNIRTEREIFSELTELCQKPGFVFVIALISLRDNFVSYSDEINEQSFEKGGPYESLLRTELTALIALMCKAPLRHKNLSDKDINSLVAETESLLHDLHVSVFKLTNGHTEPPYRDLNDRRWLREAVFYAGESTYGSQYQELSVKRYSLDDEWFRDHKGFTATQASSLASSLHSIINRKISKVFSCYEDLQNNPSLALNCLTFSKDELIKESNLSLSIVSGFLEAFTLDAPIPPTSFSHVTDFNPCFAFPVIKSGDDYSVLQVTNLICALYATPFYWMVSDKSYYSSFIKNRGDFTEAFAAERLTNVFGKYRVYKNVTIIRSKAETLGEIDVLVIYGDRLIIVQAKSKQLTQRSRQGNTEEHESDFKKGIQDSYDQAHSCATLLLDENRYAIISEGHTEVPLPEVIKEIYPLCVISDYFPSLNSQLDHYLVTNSTSKIRPPYVMDVFFMDIVCEFLDSPLHFLSYINLRSSNRNFVHGASELPILDAHLKVGLWKESNKFSLVLGDKSSPSIDAAFCVRREGLPGSDTPKGILTEFKNTAYEQILKSIDSVSQPSAIETGFFLLQMSPQDKKEFNKALEEIISRAKIDGKNHNFTFRSYLGIHITIHVNDFPIEVAEGELDEHCSRRKYYAKHHQWLGLSISPTTKQVRYGVHLAFVWKQSDKMDAMTRHMEPGRKVTNLKTSRRGFTKIGRNHNCPCGSGRKFKKCCY